MPIIPDEARTFGMDSLFRELKIYASQGQKYEPVDHEMLLSYAEAANGQILEEGITEAGSTASFIAAGTAYATRGVPVVPFYTFYSMFGFQRVGDLIWQAADARTRGFLLGATAGRTTLMGEGLQHQDGHSLVLASTVPPCQAYDPAFAYEVAAIVQEGLQRMYGGNGVEDPDVFYYITLYNENYPMPAMPEGDPARAPRRDHARPVPMVAGARGSVDAGDAAVLRLGAGCARARPRPSSPSTSTSASSCGRRRRTSGCARTRSRSSAGTACTPARSRGSPTVAQLLGDAPGPIVAVTDFMKIVPEQIARFLPGRTFVPLGTDGMGRSDTRESLRRFFEIDLGHVVVGVLSALHASRPDRCRPDRGGHQALRRRPRRGRPVPRLRSQLHQPLTSTIT